jgi:hypothetical protein
MANTGKRAQGQGHASPHPAHRAPGVQEVEVEERTCRVRRAESRNVPVARGVRIRVKARRGRRIRASGAGAPRPTSLHPIFKLIINTSGAGAPQHLRVYIKSLGPLGAWGPLGISRELRPKISRALRLWAPVGRPSRTFGAALRWGLLAQGGRPISSASKASKPSDT